jgi:polyisoprenyl-phosphate glycosyltransferase
VNDPSTPEISVVVAAYNCCDCLRALHERITVSVRSITSSYEIVFVDDRSPDGSWSRLLELAEADPAVRVVRLSRNFGQHAAITAGLAESRGRWTVVLDCDLEDPPEAIPQLYAKAHDGYDIVLTERRRRNQPFLRRLAARAYFRSRNVFFGMEMGSEYATLSIISRKVVEAYLRVGDVDRQYILVLHWLGFRRAEITIEAGTRFAGRSSYRLRDLIRVAVDGYFFETTKLLRWIVYLGFALAALGLSLAASEVAAYFIVHPYPGWTSLAVLILVVGGFIMTSLGVTGLYVGKIFMQVKGRPLYLIDERRGRPHGA